MLRRVAALALLLGLSGCPSDPMPTPDAGEARDAPGADDAGSNDDAGPAGDAGVDPCAEGRCGPCDDGLALDDDDPTRAARAMGVCSGLASAEWQLPDGSGPPSSAAFPLGHGLLDDFGTVTPREGTRLLALSSGTARAPSDPGWSTPTGFDKGYSASLPAELVVESPACAGTIPGSAVDAITLALTLDVPAGANGFRFYVKHHAYEFPAYVCTMSSDAAAVVVSPAPPGAASNGDVVQDATGNPLSSASSFLEVCGCGGGACNVGGRTYACGAGRGELAGTGFDAADDAGAATRWLEVRVPAAAGSRIEIRISVWDASDPLFDSTTLVDGFRWITDAPAEVETAPVAP